MKTLAKLFLLSLCSWFLFLWFSNAQNLEWNDSLTGEYESAESWSFTVWSRENPNFEYNTQYGEVCPYDMFVIVIFKMILSWIWIILWILLIALTVKAVILYKKFEDTSKDTHLFYIPVLNLYSISKITIWKSRFFCVMLLICFFGYNVYENMHRDNSCCPDPSRQDYTWIIVWISAIIILWELLSWLSKFNKKDSTK